jgi:hypothetical protein
MKAFIEFMSNIPKEYIPEIENHITNAAKVLSDPNTTYETCNQLSKQLDELNKKVGINSAQAWQEELKEHFEGSLLRSGNFTKNQAKAFADPKINYLINKMESIRGLPKPALSAANTEMKPNYWNVFPKITLIVFGIAAVYYMTSRGISEADGLQGAIINVGNQNKLSEIKQQISQGQQAISKVDLSNDEFNFFYTSITHPNERITENGIPQMIKKYENIPVIAILPSKQEINTTIGNVYSSLPSYQSERNFENHISNIEKELNEGQLNENGDSKSAIRKEELHREYQVCGDGKTITIQSSSAEFAKKILQNQKDFDGEKH